MIFLIDPTIAAVGGCKVYCHIKPCYGVPV
jgi:hypothetical protein